MKREVGEMWKIKEGSKILWKVQFSKGILTFSTKRLAVQFQNKFIKESR